MNTPPKFIPTIETIKLRRERQNDSCKLLREFIYSVNKIESTESLRNAYHEWQSGYEVSIQQIAKREIELELERLELEYWEQKFGLK